jgi:hypothetical protein
LNHLLPAAPFLHTEIMTTTLAGCYYTPVLPSAALAISLERELLVSWNSALRTAIVVPQQQRAECILVLKRNAGS